MKFREFSSARLPIAYKYTNAEYGLRNIENKELYFSNPSMFNDIYDSRFIVKRQDVASMICTDALRNIVLETLNPSESENAEKSVNYICEITKTENVRMSDILNSIPSNLVDAVTDRIMDYVRGLYVYCNKKVACLSERKDSLSMWAYYADNYKGVCLEYSLENDERLYQHCYKVQYTDKKFNFNRTDFGMYFYKSREWEHEQEWRIVVDIDEKSTIQTNCITAVYLGVNISDKNKEKIVEAAKNKGINVYQSIANDEKYALDFEKIN